MVNIATPVKRNAEMKATLSPKFSMPMARAPRMTVKLSHDRKVRSFAKKTLGSTRVGKAMRLPGRHVRQSKITKCQLQDSIGTWGARTGSSLKERLGRHVGIAQNRRGFIVDSSSSECCVPVGSEEKERCQVKVKLAVLTSKKV